MELLCEVCDRSIIANESEYQECLTTMRKKNDKSIYNKNTIININLDDVNKTLNDYISTHNKNFDFDFINCEFVIEFYDNFTPKIETIYFYNKDIK